MTEQLHIIADPGGAVLTHHDRALPPVFRTRYEAETFLRYWRRNTARFGPVGDPAVVDAVVAEFHRLMRATPGAEREWVRP